MNRLFVTVLAVGFGLALTTAAYAETVGQKVDQAKDSAANTGETIKEKTKETGEIIKDKTKAAGETVKEKTEEATEKVKEKAHEAQEKKTGHKDRVTTTKADEVTTVQQALKDKGHDPGMIDGRMGPRTRAAIKNYQQAEGLKVTGRLDDETRARLGMPMRTSKRDHMMSPSASPRTSQKPGN